MDKTPIPPQTNIAELIRVYPQVVPVLIEHHMACVGCSMSEFESLEDAAQVYHLSLDTLLAAIQNITLHAETSGKKPASQSKAYTLFANLQHLLALTEEGIERRILHQDSYSTTTLFVLASGQTLEEQTREKPAILQVLEGGCTLNLSGQHCPLKAGAWLYLPPAEAFTIQARAPTRLLLTQL